MGIVDCCASTEPQGERETDKNPSGGLRAKNQDADEEEMPLVKTETTHSAPAGKKQEVTEPAKAKEAVKEEKKATSSQEESKKPSQPSSGETFGMPPGRPPTNDPPPSKKRDPMMLGLFDSDEDENTRAGPLKEEDKVDSRENQVYIKNIIGDSRKTQYFLQDKDRNMHNVYVQYVGNATCVGHNG